MLFKSYPFLAPPLGSAFWLRKGARGPNGRKIMESIGFWYSNPTHFWRPSRIRFLAPNYLRSPNGRKIMEPIRFWHSNPKHVWHPSRIRFLAPNKLRSLNGICFLAPKERRSSSWQREIAPEFHSWDFNLTNPYNCCNLLRRMYAALQREPHFEKEPASIRETVADF